MSIFHSQFFCSLLVWYFSFNLTWKTPFVVILNVRFLLIWQKTLQNACILCVKSYAVKPNDKVHFHLYLCMWFEECLKACHSHYSHCHIQIRHIWMLLKAASFFMLTWTENNISICSEILLNKLQFQECRCIYWNRSRQIIES